MNERVVSSLVERFAAPLPEFYRRRIIFWKDEDREFEEEIDGLELPEVKLVKLTGSNHFAVKKLLLHDDLESNFLIYCPITYEKQQDDWLQDIELYSEEFRADLVSMQMEELGIAPSAAMRKTVKLYAKFFENKERRQKLKKIGQGFETPLQLHIGVMAVLAGLSGSSAQDVIIAVLSAGLDKEQNPVLQNIQRFGNLDVFWQLAEKYTGYAEEAEKPLIHFAAHILLTALSQTMPASALRGLERFLSGTNQAYCYSLVHEWRAKEQTAQGSVMQGSTVQSNFLQESSVQGNSALQTETDSESCGSLSLYEICRCVEQELQLPTRFDKLECEKLLGSDVFPCIDESILKQFYREISERVVKAELIAKVCESRRTAGWQAMFSEHYVCLEAIGRMQAFYEAHADGFHITSPAELWKNYTEEFCQMDRLYRKFHLAFGNSLKASNEVLEDGLKHAAEYVEVLYQDWYLTELSACWTRTAADDLAALGYVSEIPKQREFYRKYVKASVKQNTRAFVVISDALRYEVAEELCTRISRSGRGKAAIESMQAVFPSVTKFGMAALLPGKTLSVNEEIDKGIEVLSDGLLTRSTAERERVLQAAQEESAAVQYTELLNMKQAERRALVAGKNVVYIYHNAIDAIGDKAATETKVFEACETAIEELSNLLRIITNELSGTNIFITADHGFLYTYRALCESDKLDRSCFDGTVYELGRRYALCAPETKAAYLLPVALSAQYEGVPLLGYAPKDTIRMKVQGGGENYVHGGISLQELCVPVIVFKHIRAANKNYVAVQNAELALLSESRKISNLIFSLDFYQKQPVGDKVQNCTYQLYLTDEAGAVISDHRQVIADKTSENAAERMFRVCFHLKAGAYDKKQTYRLVIANETEIEEIAFQIDIALADDFGFDL